MAKKTAKKVTKKKATTAKSKVRRATQRSANVDSPKRKVVLIRGAQRHGHNRAANRRSQLKRDHRG